MEQVIVTFRVEASLKQACEQALRANDNTLSRMLRTAMRQYVAAHAQQTLPLKPVRRAARNTC